MNEVIIAVGELEAEERKQKAKERQEYYNRLYNEDGFAFQPDDDMRNPWNNLISKEEKQKYIDEPKTFASKVRNGLNNIKSIQAKPSNINRFDAAGVQLMSRIEGGEFNATNPLTKIEQQLIRDFLTPLTRQEGDLGQFLDDTLVLVNYFSDEQTITTKQGCDSVRNIIYRTRNNQILDNAMVRLERLANSMKYYDGNIHDEILFENSSKFTLAEFSATGDLAALKETFKKLEKAGFNYDDPKSYQLNRLYQKSIIAEKLVSGIQKVSNQNLENSNIIAFTNESRKQIVLNQASASYLSSLIIYMKSFFVSLSYVTTFSSAKSTSFAENHQKFDVKQMLYSDMYEFDVIKLIDKDAVKTLEDKLGANWENIVRAKFRNICQKFEYSHQAPKESELSAHDIVSNGLTSFGNIALKENDFKEIAEKMSSDYVDRSSERGLIVLSSSLTAKAMVANLIELQKEIRNDINNIKKETVSSKDKKELDDLKGNVINRQTNESNSKSYLKEDFINIPFSKHENLDNITPDRLLKVLKEKDCMRPKSNAFRNVVDISR